MRNERIDGYLETVCEAQRISNIRKVIHEAAEEYYSKKFVKVGPHEFIVNQVRKQYNLRTDEEINRLISQVIDWDEGAGEVKSTNL